jgi:ribosomal protein L25 (general stress protein Ctc)
MTFERKHFEIVFRTMTGISYFLWIQVEDEKMPAIIEKYNLKPMS